MFSRIAKTAVALFTVATLAMVGVPILEPQTAFADGGDTGAEVSDLQKRVEETAAAYDDASKKVEEVQKRIDENDASIAKIRKELPKRQEKAAAAMNALYKMQNQSSGLIDLVLGIDSIDDLLRTTNYLSAVQDRNVDAITDLNTAQSELKQKSEQLAADRQSAVKEQEKAKQASDEAVAARQEAQRRAEEEAARQAAEAAAAAEQDAGQDVSDNMADDDKSASASKASGKSSKSSTKKTSKKSGSTSGSSDTEEVSGSVPAVASGGVDWSVGKSKFIKIWTARIDNYLAGSPLSGQGKAFATAAWNYGVDPRWSPAISCTESSKGASCFKPYNAWGWGSASWGSWPEAIDAHVAGLARGYGSTISVQAAKTYCPPRWYHWYTTTLGQMNSI